MNNYDSFHFIHIDSIQFILIDQKKKTQGG